VTEGRAAAARDRCVTEASKPLSLRQHQHSQQPFSDNDSFEASICVSSAYQCTPKHMQVAACVIDEACEKCRLRKVNDCVTPK
jgi:hypothetical protein